MRETRGSADPIEIRARRLRDALEELGPTFAKLGQILSTRPDLLPPEFIIELASLQDDVAPLTEAEVVQVMEEELGVPWEDVFASIDSEPLAAGTRAQGGRRPVARSLLPPGPHRRFLPCRPASWEPALVGREDLLPRSRHGRRGGARRPRPGPAAPARLLAGGRPFPRRDPAP